MLGCTVALGLLVACCLAQERPLLPNSFTAEYTAEQIYYDQTGEVRDYGRGWQAFDYSGQRSVHNTTYNTRQGEELHYTLSRYDLGKRFSIRSDNIFEPDCTDEDLFGVTPPYFDWLSFAAYRGRHEWTNGQELDFWYVQVEADVHEVGVRPDDSNDLVVYIRHHGYQSRTSVHTYTYIRQATPDPDLFEIPRVCQEAGGNTVQSRVRLRRSDRN